MAYHGIIVDRSGTDMYDDYIELLREFGIITSRNEHLADDVKNILKACTSDNDLERKLRQLTVNGMTVKTFIKTYGGVQ